MSDPLLTPAQVKRLVKVPEVLDDETAQDMIDTAMARARLLAPCLADDYDGDPLTADELVVVRDVLRDAVVRWADGGRGIVAAQAKGEYSETLRNTNTLGLFRPNDIRELQNVCKDARKRGKASTTVVGFPYAYGSEPQHVEWCSWNFHPDRLHNICDCGAILTADGSPLY
ncbi:head-to-tail adaptor [Gordonia phage Yakult]|nr:head-to-tail adaptor [Gordonia phage Yakult]